MKVYNNIIIKNERFPIISKENMKIRELKTLYYCNSQALNTE